MTLTLQDIPLELDVALRRREELHRPVGEVAVEAMKAGLGLEKPQTTANQSNNLAAAIRSRFGPLLLHSDRAC